MNLDTKLIGPFKGSLVGFLGEKVKILGYVTIMTTFSMDENSKKLKITYMVINSPSSYNIPIGSPTFNALEVVMSMFYLTMKYPLRNE